MRNSIVRLAVAAGLAATAVSFAPHARAAASHNISGRWATEGFGSIVEFRRCAEAPGESYGRIVWLWEPASDGRPRVDRSNPGPSLRTRPLVGIEIISGLRETSPGFWTGWRLYNPDDGRTYAGSARTKGGLLELGGCALNVICRSQTWRRPQDVLAAAKER